MLFQIVFFAQYLAVEQPNTSTHVDQKNPVGKDQELAQQDRCKGHKDGILAMSNTGDIEEKVHPFKSHIASVLPMWTLALQIICWHLAFNDYLSSSRHLDINCLALHQFYGFAGNTPGYCIFIRSKRDLYNGGKAYIWSWP